LLCNQLGAPLDFRLTAGQVHDSTQACALLGQRRAQAVIADKGYDADAIVQHIQATGAKPVIPPKCNRRVKRKFSKTLYRQRNCIERTFARLKHFRRLATRYDKNTACYHSFVALACSMILLNLYVDTP
jgi:transposase